MLIITQVICAIDDAINKVFILVEFIMANVIITIEVIASLRMFLDKNNFIKMIRGRNFCHVIMSRLLSHLINLLILRIHLCAGNMPILHITLKATISIRFGLLVS